MRLTYFGHCAFRWETPGGVTAVADPYRNQADRYWFTRLFPEVRCDLGLITHAHFDHDAVERLPQAASILRMPGEFATGDLRILGVGDFHSGAARLRDFPNVMFRLNAGGANFLHIGDNRAEWPDEVAREVGDIDVLLVTVDDSNHPAHLRTSRLPGQPAATSGHRPNALRHPRSARGGLRAPAAGGLAGAPAHGAPPGDGPG